MWRKTVSLSPEPDRPVSIVRLRCENAVTVDRSFCLSDEFYTPYDRPPLSKDLSGVAKPIVALGDLVAKGVDLRLGIGVNAVDRNRREVHLSDGETLSYGTLVLATGGAARSLAALPVDGRRVFTLRTLQDARGIAAALNSRCSVLVVGGGWLGLEVAAAARRRLCHVTLLEAGTRVCQRTLPDAVSDHLHRLHAASGTAIETGVTASFTITHDRVCARWIGGAGEFDVTIVAAGMTPNDAIARAAGLDCDNEIVTDSVGRTSDPTIYAVGDVASEFDERVGRRIRLESWTGAIIQARRTAQAICERPIATMEAPWFWSEQYDQMVLVAGLPQPGLSLLSFEDGTRPLWRYGQHGDVTLVVGINRARDVRMAHRMLSRSIQ